MLDEGQQLKDVRSLQKIDQVCKPSRAEVRNVTHPFLDLDVGARCELSHLFDHDVDGLLEVIEEAIRPLLCSFRSPIPEEFRCRLNAHGGYIRAQRCNLWL